MPAAVTVIGVGCELDRLFAGQPPALPIPAPPGRDDLRDLFDVIAGPLRRRDSVIVIVGAWMPEESLRGVHTVRSLLQTDRVAVHVTELPPLAASVLAALAAALSSVAPSAGVLASALGAVGQSLHILAWTGSVAGLQHPSVSMLHHARSLVPGSSFGVGLQPDPFVQPLSRGRMEAPLEPSDHALELLVAPAERGDLTWILDAVSPALGDVPVREIPPTIHGPDWWGTSRLVEAVGVPSSLDWIARAAFAGNIGPCLWCGEPILAAPCPFCGEALSPAAPRQRTNSLAAGLKEQEHGV